MMSVDQALAIVLQNSKTQGVVSQELTADLIDLTLAEDVCSDLDMPPFDKALMDGYAVHVPDVAQTDILPVSAEWLAGQTPGPLAAGSAARIMTGAPIPPGADAVIRVEQSRLLDDGRVKFDPPAPKSGQFIMRRGAEMKNGDVVLRAGTVIRPAEIGLLASVGRAGVQVIPAPAVAVLATGDELVEPDQKPGPAQLRNSNGPMLAAQAARAGAKPVVLGIARDNVESLRTLIETGLKYPILALAGGVSMGKRDLVPEVLKEVGVTAYVYQIAMKPGKPFFFGTRGETLVFGLPGNPVSSFCCFELFVRPAIRKLAGHHDCGPTWQTASLGEEFKHRSDRPTYHPAMLENVDGINRVRPAAWLGSPDLRALTKANALIRLPAGEHSFAAGESMSVLPIK